MKLSGDYYSEHLSSERLRKCYEIAPPRVKQYLQAEVDFVLRYVEPDDRVLELGCGYGRAIATVAGRTKVTVGIDTSLNSLEMAATIISGCHYVVADAGRLALSGDSFDVVFCIQNGISAFGIDRSRLIDEAVRVTKPGGRVLFSSYSEGFWEDRFEWFRLQASHGLLGEIDESTTGDGVIVCGDGFRAETVARDEFVRLAAHAGVDAEIIEVDGSALFCVARKASSGSR